MYVCICQGITESQIRDAIRGGAHNMQSLCAELGVGAQCGTCSCAAESILEEVREEPGERRRPALTLVAASR